MFLFFLYIVLVLFVGLNVFKDLAKQSFKLYHTPPPPLSPLLTKSKHKQICLCEGFLYLTTDTGTKVHIPYEVNHIFGLIENIKNQH